MNRQFIKKHLKMVNNEFLDVGEQGRRVSRKVECRHCKMLLIPQFHRLVKHLRRCDACPVRIRQILQLNGMHFSFRIFEDNGFAI